MPWIKNNAGEDEYHVSLYAKEELPTWDEMYTEFYKRELFSYTKDDTELDPYWKIPRAQVLLTTCCNQLNKMIFEDKVDLNIDMAGADIRFIIEGYTNPFMVKTFYGTIKTFDRYRLDQDLWYEKHLLGKGNPPPIYSIHNPNGIENPFITNKHPRIYIQDEDKTGYGTLRLLVTRDRFTWSYGPMLRSVIYYQVIDKLMEQLKEYFEGGEVPGWKDADGKLIQCKKENGCTSGFDPAL